MFSFFDIFMSSGTVLAFVLAKYFDYVAQAKVHLVVSILFVIVFARIPDSPQHLVNVQRQKVCNGKSCRELSNIFEITFSGSKPFTIVLQGNRIREIACE